MPKRTSKADAYSRRKLHGPLPQRSVTITAPAPQFDVSPSCFSLDDGIDPVYCPFRVVIDSNEQQPFTFTGFNTSAFATKSGEIRSPSALAKGVVLTRNGGRPLIVETCVKPLWSLGRQQHGAGLGDYAIDGMEECCSVETKHSLGDLFSSIGQRGENFEAEIASLNKRCDFAAVVVCGTLGQVARYTPPHGFADSDRRSTSPASVRGTILAWMQRYPKVHWAFCPTRFECERLTFEILERYWRDHQ